MEVKGDLEPCPSCGHLCPKDSFVCPQCNKRLRWITTKFIPIVPGGGDPNVEMPRIALLLVVGAVVILLFMLYAGYR
ncbi:MAG TPA: hypothetical protein VGD02_06545 [Gemmatimonadaceae bacterium]|jgi:hypothetical protein